MKKINTLLLSVLGLFFIVPMVLYAADAPADIGAAIGGMIDAVKIGKWAAIVAAIIQLLKTPLLGSILNKINPKIIPISLVVGGVIVNVGSAMANGKDILGAAIEALFISGGAMALYDLFKPIIPKNN